MNKLTVLMGRMAGLTAGRASRSAGAESSVEPSRRTSSERRPYRLPMLLACAC
jgi:hypothetical protein